MWTWITRLSILLMYSDRSLLGNKLFRNSDQLFEGNQCYMENGAEVGVCRKVADCPERIKQIHTGNYRVADRCGFDRFDEIVCCKPMILSEKSKRPADDACESYKKIVIQPKEEDGFVYITVVNGVLAKVGEFPHMAALGYVASKEEGYPGDVKYICGGTLISQKHVLTAAHCVNNIQGLVPVEVLLGTVDVKDPDKTAAQRIQISRIIDHPEYRTSLNYHDIAILELRTSVTYTTHVQPTCLLTRPVTEKTDELVVLGWGAVDLGGETSNKLLKAEGLELVGKSDCSTSYQNVGTHIPRGLDNGMVCVRDPDVTRNADTCWGDSGGPLLVRQTKFPPLAGITSFGRACGSRTPGVYSSVYQYLTWIEEQVWPAVSK